MPRRSSNRRMSFGRWVKIVEETSMILLALNELNLDYIKGYVSQGKLTNFENCWNMAL